MEIGQLREIPSMNALLNHALFENTERESVKLVAQLFLDELRDGLVAGKIAQIPSLDDCAAQILARVRTTDAPRLRGVVNATGVVLHTNLGRAPLGAEAYAAAEHVYTGYGNLEYDLETGLRGSRHNHVESLLRELTGAQAAVVVNNAAAAVLLMLAALAKGKRVAVSRGELVEIGGSFRVPEIMEQSGAVLDEVGTTNRTRLTDYVNAAQNGAAALLKVHTSNYKIVGFTEAVSLGELAAYGRANALPVLYDMGSCFITDPQIDGLAVGETARDAIASGASVICFSGDKLLGSAQAGVIAGDAELIAKIRKHPLMRALRPDKLTLNALETTLRLCRHPSVARRKIPALAMLSATAEELQRRADALAERVRSVCPTWRVAVRAVEDEAGGGSLPGVALGGYAVAINPTEISVDELERRLRRGAVPIIIRISDDTALLSVRTLLLGDDEVVVAGLRAAYE